MPSGAAPAPPVEPVQDRGESTPPPPSVASPVPFERQPVASGIAGLASDCVTIFRFHDARIRQPRGKSRIVEETSVGQPVLRAGVVIVSRVVQPQRLLVELQGLVQLSGLRLQRSFIHVGHALKLGPVGSARQASPPGDKTAPPCSVCEERAWQSAMRSTIAITLVGSRTILRRLPRNLFREMSCSAMPRPALCPRDRVRRQ